jgi:uncharacterized protein (TIGR02996 family)
MKSLHQALEAELAANPDDLATHAAYADLLTEEGDARGEFIQVQTALEDSSLPEEERHRLEARERQLLGSYRERWLGPLAHFLRERGHRYRFRRGWLDAIEVGRISLPFARALRDAPQVRLLRELSIDSAVYDEHADVHPDDGVPEGEPRPAFWPLVNAENLRNVRNLTLGENDGDHYTDYHCTLCTEVVPLLLRGLPLLEEVRVFARGYSLAEVFALPLKDLRVLQVHHNSQVYRLDVLANNPAMRQLTHLLCHPHALAWHDNREEDEAAGFRKEEGYLPLSVVRALLRSPHLRHLTHLQLRLSSMGDEGCEEVVRSGILARLKVLDLRHGRISDAGARTLAECPDTRKLEVLDLQRNALTERGFALLAPLGAAVRRDPRLDEHDLTEDGYLHEGDYE